MDDFNFMDEEKTKIYQAYVDGSFIDNRVGYAAIILANGKIEAKLSGEVTEHKHARQVTGEIEAVLQVLKYCQKKGIPKIQVVYDYLGLECWATGKWKRKQALTKNYYEAIKKSPVKITWQKVKSHSGNLWNEQVDSLAKKAILNNH